MTKPELPPLSPEEQAEFDTALALSDALTFDVLPVMMPAWMFVSANVRTPEGIKLSEQLVDAHRAIIAASTAVAAWVNVRFPGRCLFQPTDMHGVNVGEPVNPAEVAKNAN